MTARAGLAAAASRVRHPRTTVRWRLTLLYGGLFLISGAALLAVTYALVEHATISRLPGGITFVRAGRPVVQQPPPGHRSIKLPADAALPPGLRRALSSRAGKQVVRSVGTEQRISDLHQLEVESIIALVIMAIISTLLGWLVAGRVLRPLRTMTTATHRITAANLHERLEMGGPRDELRRLADTIDGLLGRLESAFDVQRRFVANASHELRTPLTATRAVLEMVLTDPRATVATFRDACEQALEESEHQEQLIDALLTLARSQREITRGEEVDLAAVAAALLPGQRAEATARDVALDVDLRRAPLRGDPRLVERLVANLVENAIRHNVPGGRVRIGVESRAGRATLTASNTGPVVPATELERLLQPFQRLESERTGYGDGLGLGLSIVAAITAAHGARLDVRPGDGGGLDVEVSFPAAAALTAGDPAPPHALAAR